jgi:leader peptidase (prepilin peptidase)/N-methyltransferase
MSSAWIVTAAALAGWLLGSFLNTLVDRTPHRAGHSGRPGAVRGWFRPLRSVCLSCGRSIPWQRNLPIISYLWLRGRCSNCGAAIGVRTLAVEAAAPALFAAGAGALAGAGWAAQLWGVAALSWALVTVPLVAERRRLRAAGIAGAVLVAWLAALLLG